jgi:PAS domain S-box-containing protein
MLQQHSALGESEQLLELFFSQSLDGFFFMMLDEPVRWDDSVDKAAILDYVFSHQRVTKVNDAMLAQYGATREQLIGLTPGAFYAHNLEYGKEIWRQFFDAGRLHTETDERRFDDGTPIRIEGDYICLYTPDRRIAGHFGIQRNVTERHRTDRRMRRSRRELRALAARLQSVREAERRRIAHEIHDELGQALTAFKMDLAWVAGRLRADQPDLMEQVTSMLGRVDETVATVRRIATELRPSVLDNLGLVAAIEWQGSEFEKRTGIIVTLDLPPDTLELEEGRATTVFRMVQEALTNVARHSKATEAAVALELRDGTLQLQVKDNGRGITEDQSYGTSSLGLVGLRERALACGGTLSISGVPGQGTTITACIPLVSSG